MHYWNDANFEGLDAIAGALEKDARLSSLAEYCRFREKGLRRDAFRALDTFIVRAKGWETQQARELCQRILELHACTPEVHQFLSQPLLDKFVFPVLEDWLDDQPESHAALRWVGLLRRDENLLRRALLVCPTDSPVRNRIVDYILGDVEYATHHLVESQFLGDLEATKQSLSDAFAIIEDAPDPKSVSHLKSEAEEYRVLLQDWEAYSASPTGTFPEWCELNGRSYSWPTIYYYKK